MALILTILFDILFIAGVIVLIVILKKRSTAKREKERISKERSDMEKQLIKQNKIDALASIKPNDPEQAQKQLELIRQLDELEKEEVKYANKSTFSLGIFILLLILFWPAAIIYAVVVTRK